MIVYFAQLAGVDDVINVLDCVGYLGAKQPVGIGNNGYRDHSATGLWPGKSSNVGNDKSVGLE